MTGKTETRVREIRSRTRQYRRQHENRVLSSLAAFSLFLLAGIGVLFRSVQTPGVAAVADGYGAVLLRDGAVTYGFDTDGVTDKASLSAVYQANGSTKQDNFSSGNKPTANGVITFTVSDVADGYEIEGWYVNDVKQNGQTGLTYAYSVTANVGADVKVKIIRSSYTVTFSGENGTVSAAVSVDPISSGDSVVGDTTVTFTAAPAGATGYTFAGWTVDGAASEETTESLTLTITKDTVVKASYTMDEVRYTVTYGVIGENGTLSARRLDADNTAAAGSNVAFTAKPADGYRVKGWYSNADGTAAIPGTTFEQNSYTLENLLADAGVYVAFEPIPTYDITVTVTGLGTMTATVNGKDAVITGNTLTVSRHDNVVLTATPDAYQYLTGWTLDGADQGNGSMTLTLTDVTDNHTVTADFAASQLVEFRTVCGENGSLTAQAGYGETLSTIDASTGISLEKGKKVVVTARPNTGYMVKEWKVNGVVQDNLSNTLTIENLSEATTVTVEYETPATMHSIPNPDPDAGYTVGKIIKNPADYGTEYEIRDRGTVTFTVVPTEGKTITSLTCSNSTVTRNDDGSYTVTVENVESDIKLDVSVIDGIPLTINCGENGTLTVKRNDENLTTGAALQIGDTLTITAAPANGYQLSSLTVNGTTISSGSSYTVIEGDTALTIAAAFTKSTTPSGGGGGGGGAVAPAETVIIKDSVNGKVTADNTYAKEGNTVTLTVKPDKGYTLETLIVTNKNGDELKLKDNGDGKYTFTMPASNVTIKATFMEDNSMLNFFVDVPADAYYYDAVLWAAKEGITGGTDATHFSPNVICTRAQAVTFLWRAAGSPAPKSSAMPFTDVAEGSYYHDAVLWAVEQGITKGTSETTFSPDDKCTRAQIVSFLWRSQKSPAAGSMNPFTDVAADAYYANAVLWAVENGITAGTTATTFSPNNDCTRAQIVTFLYRCMK